jgi:hypothetical protein
MKTPLPHMLFPPTFRQLSGAALSANIAMVQPVETPSCRLQPVHAPSWQRQFLSFTGAGAKISAVTSKPNVAFA